MNKALSMQILSILSGLYVIICLSVVTIYSQDTETVSLEMMSNSPTIISYDYEGHYVPLNDDIYIEYDFWIDSLGNERILLTDFFTYNKKQKTMHYRGGLMPIVGDPEYRSPIAYQVIRVLANDGDTVSIIETPFYVSYDINDNLHSLRIHYMDYIIGVSFLDDEMYKIQYLESPSDTNEHSYWWLNHRI